MDKRTRSAAVGGVLLILLGALLLLAQINPAWRGLLGLEGSWPMIVVAVGLGLGVVGLITGAPGTGFPAGIGAESILVSLVLFLIFGSLFGGMTGLGPYWPALLVLVGAVQLVRRVLRPYSLAAREASLPPMPPPPPA